MKKLLTALLLAAPIFVSACGMFVYIIPTPNAEFLTRSGDMDHSTILDLNNGVEEMWMNIKKPFGYQGSSIITVTPVPTPGKLVSVENVEKEKVPAPAQGLKITYQRMWNKFSMTVADFAWSLFIPALFIFFALVGMARLRVARNKKIGVPNGKYEEWMSSVSIFTLLVVIIATVLTWGIIGYQQSTLGLTGEVTLGAPPMFMVPDANERVTVVYSTTTANGMVLQVVEAEDGKGLSHYLERNGLPKSPSGETTLDGYVKKGFSFVVTQTQTASLANEERRFLHITFPSQRLFFPLGVNYAASEMVHGVKALVLKPVTISGFSSDLESESNQIYYIHPPQDETPKKNRSIAYYGNDMGEPSSSVVNFYDKEKNYDYDVYMDIGTPWQSVVFRYLDSWAVTFILALMLDALLVVFFAFVDVRMHKRSPRLHRVMTLLASALIATAIIFIAYAFASAGSYY